MKKKTIRLWCAWGLFGFGAVAVAAGPQAYCRFFPDRGDDFAWENDKVAFRVYGPAKRHKPENSGIDCWLKRVDYPIVEKWYALSKEGVSYHEDHGEGSDPYHVGSSAGCGGTGIWLNDHREPLEAFVKQEVLECTPARAVFKLTYERDLEGVVYGEEKTIALEFGSRLFNVRSVFTRNGAIAADLPICIGLTTHEGRAAVSSRVGNGWMACWETIEGYGLGTGVVMDTARIEQFKVVESRNAEEGHALFIVRTDARGQVEFRAGYGWEKVGAIKTSEDWMDYLNRIAACGKE